MMWEMKQGLKDLRRSCSSLAGPQLRWITLNLLLLWVVSAFVYYGLVILVAQNDFIEGGSKECHDGKFYVPVGALASLDDSNFVEVVRVRGQ